MPVEQINFTGRQTIASRDIKVILHDQETPVSFEATHLSLETYNLPDTALVRLEAYRGPFKSPYDLGCVARFALPGRISLPEFVRPDRIRFRIKVTSADEPTRGQILAVGNRIQPDWQSGNKESLLPVRPVPYLDHEVFRLTFEEEGPVLLVNDSLSQWRELTRDHPYFVSLVYPASVRAIFTHILHEEVQLDMDNPDHWASQWIRFAENHLKAGTRPQSEEDKEVALGWIDGVAESFARKNQTFALFSRERNREDDR